MSDAESNAWDTPTLEVRVYRDGTMVQRELCESEAEATAVLDAWSDVEGVVCQVDDLSSGRTPAGVLEPQRWEVDPDDSSHDRIYDDKDEEDR